MVFRVSVALFIVTIFLQSESQAQRFPARQIFRPAQTTSRFLGAWQGHGYHWCQKGPDASYYNPYSAHNSSLVTQGYSFQDEAFYHNVPTQTFHHHYHQPTMNPHHSAPPTTLPGNYEKFEENKEQQQMVPVEGQQPQKEKQPNTILNTSQVSQQGNADNQNYNDELILDVFDN